MKKTVSHILSAAFVLLLITGCSSKNLEDGMIKIEGGQFVMGNDSIKLPWGFYSHKAHDVTLSDFYVAPCEVTQKSFEQIMGYNPSFYSGDGENKTAAAGEIPELRPVEKVTWYEAIVYCNKLSEKMGLTPVYSKRISSEAEDSTDSTLKNKDSDYSKDISLWGECPSDKGQNDWNDIKWDRKANGYRLLTEAEWEYVCTGGMLSENFTSSGFNFSDSAVTNQYCWNANNSNLRTHQTGILSPNELGIYDMAGNVWEWCWDWFDEDFYSTEAASEKNTAGPETGEFRTLRGSTWDDSETELAAIARGSASPYIPSRRGGFRVARNIH